MNRPSPLVSQPFDVDDYDYELPRSLIAQEPLARRSDARMLIVRRGEGSLVHRHVRDLPDVLSPHDCLVINDTKVVPAKLAGRRTATGGRWTGLFLSVEPDGHWRLICKTRGSLRAGEAVSLLNRKGEEDTRLWLLEKLPGGVWKAHPDTAEDTWSLLDRLGRVPLPHYIRRESPGGLDRQRYQTVYARTPGAVAAPTAGLHFTDELLRTLIDAGLSICRVTLHVGLDTFRPISSSLAEHRMHSEWGQILPEAVTRIRQCRQRGGRVVAVGTTSVRVLETAARSGELVPWSGTTDLFIRPPFQFRAVDALLTNFHLPRTTLLVLVRTFGGHELLARAYEAAIREQYRFFSYGDAMLIV